MRNSILLGGAWALSLTLLPTVAEGSPWTLSKGTALLRTGFDMQVATSEFIDEGGEQAFPLNGRFTGANLNLGLRVGVFDGIEFEASLPIRVIAYTAEPAILAPAFQGTDPDAARAFYQNNILDFTQSTVGVGDLRFAGRYQLALQPVATAFELGLKVPTGYRGPEGTFGRQPDTVEAFEASTDVVQPDNIRDDITLGDAQVDVTAQILLGTVLPTETFIRAGVGYNLRLGGAGDQLLGDVRVGQSVAERWLVFAFGRIAYTVEEGRSIGVTVVARDPSLTAAEFGEPGNAVPIVRRLESNALDVGGGVIWRIGGPAELNVAYTRTVWGRFVAATNTVSISMGFRFDVFGDAE